MGRPGHQEPELTLSMALYMRASGLCFWLVAAASSDLLLSAHPASCSAAAALKVSPATNST